METKNLVDILIVLLLIFLGVRIIFIIGFHRGFIVGKATKIIGRKNKEKRSD